MNNIQKLSPFDTLPTEICTSIFMYLPAKELLKCTQICIRWNEIVQMLKKRNYLWLTYYNDDLKNKYYKVNIQEGLSWYETYKSLTLWRKLSLASETIDEFAAASHVSDEIKNIIITKSGLVAVHKHNLIMYYNINTNSSDKDFIVGDFLRYYENEQIFVTVDFRLQLKIAYKTNTFEKTNIIFNNVKFFLTVDNMVYYVNLTDDIYLCTLEKKQYFKNRFIDRFEDGVMCLGYSDNHLNVLTFQRSIYSLSRQGFIFICTIESDNLLYTLREYNFLEYLDWRIYFQWMYVLNHNIPESPLRDIVTIRTYGDIVFVGSNWGDLRIYYAPYSSGELDLLHSHPMKQYNFMEQLHNCPYLSMCPIIQIEVLEIKNGHKIFVAMPKKVVIINFLHDFY